MRRRTVFYALLAMAVPLPALALSGGDGSEVSDGSAATITVSASLDSCGTAASTIVCKIDATWNDVPGAERYAASVTRADGSVMDYGDVGAGSGSFWVPYVGNGTYTVTVSAYGTAPGQERARVIAKGSSGAGSGGRGVTEQFGTGHAAPDDGAPDGTPGGGDGEVPVSEPPAEEPVDPSCEEPEPDPEEPPGEAPGETPGAAGQPLSTEAAATLDERAELPDSVECPEPEPKSASAP